MTGQGVRRDKMSEMENTDQVRRKELGGWTLANQNAGEKAWQN